MEKIKDNIFLTNNEIDKLDFFETLYYIQTLNQIDKAIQETPKEKIGK